MAWVWHWSPFLWQSMVGPHTYWPRGPGYPSHPQIDTWPFISLWGGAGLPRSIGPRRWKACHTAITIPSLPSLVLQDARAFLSLVFAALPSHACCWSCTFSRETFQINFLQKLGHCEFGRSPGIGDCSSWIVLYKISQAEWRQFTEAIWTISPLFI